MHRADPAGAGKKCRLEQEIETRNPPWFPNGEDSDQEKEGRVTDGDKGSGYWNNVPAPSLKPATLQKRLFSSPNLDAIALVLTSVNLPYMTG
jgi:hypothetical protein